MARSDGKRSEVSTRSHCRDEQHRIICEFAFVEMTGFPRHELIESTLPPSILTGMGFLTPQVDIAFRAAQPAPFVFRNEAAGVCRHHQFRTIAIPRSFGIVTSGYLEQSASRAGTAVRTWSSEAQMESRKTWACRAGLAQSHAAILDLEGNECRLFLSPRTHNWRRLRPGELGEPRGSQFAGVRCFPVTASARLWSRTESTPKRQHTAERMPFVAMFSELNRFLIQEIASSGMFVTLRCQDRCTTTHDVLCRRWPSPAMWPVVARVRYPRVARHDTWRAAGAVENTATLEVQPSG